MALTLRQLNRATLQRQSLLERATLDVVAATRQIVALQAQDPVGPYLALWARIAGFEPAALDAAYVAGELVRGHLLRITIHTVAAADYPAFHAAMQPTLRAARLSDERFERAGLSIPDTDALIPELAAFLIEPRASDEVEAWLDDRIGVRERPGAWWALRHYGPFIHAPVGAPWTFASKRVMTAARAGAVVDTDAGIEALVRAVLRGFGPMTLPDLRQATMVESSRLRAAVDRLGDAVVRPDGRRLDVADAPPLPDEATPAPPRLLPMWDEILLAYTDRSRVLPDELRPHVIRRNGDVLPTVLVDGFVAGVWRPHADGGIELTALTKLDDDAWAALDAEARSLDGLLAARDRAIYRRHQAWWSSLPALEVRVLGR